MKRINYLIILSFFFTLSMTGCAGYKPIFSSTNLNFIIKDYSIEGDLQLAKQVYNKLSIISKSSEKKSNSRSVSLNIKVVTEKEATTKDSAGKVLDYKIILDTKILVKDYYTDYNILDEIFNKSSSYTVQKQYSETLKIENKQVKNLIDRTYEEIIIRLSENISKE